MKKAVSVVSQSKPVMFGKMTFIPLASVTLLLSACGGGGSSGSTLGAPTQSTPPIGPTPLLQVGTQAQYTGTTTQTLVTPGTTGVLQNNTTVFTFSKTRSVLQAPANVAASLDVRFVTTYTMVQDPGTGVVPISETDDYYQNIVTTGNAQALSTVAETDTLLQNDEASDALGGGPYTITNISKITYPNTTPGLSFPLQTGAMRIEPNALVSNFSFNEANVGGQVPPGGASSAYTGVQTQNNDGSGSNRVTWANGASQSSTTNANGSVSYSWNTPTVAYTSIFGVPVLSNGAYTIPISTMMTVPNQGMSTNSIPDWYPGNGAPPSLLISTIQTVIGPVATLPSSCNGALIQSNMVEIDTNESNLNPLSGLYVRKTQDFNANGTPVCTLTQSTFYYYSNFSGVLTSTTMTQSTTLLKAIVPAN